MRASRSWRPPIRQFQHDIGRDNAILLHVTLIPYLKASGEIEDEAHPRQA